MAAAERKRSGRLAASIAAVGGAFAACAYLAFQASPWPSALLIRRAFKKDARALSRALAAHVPSGVCGQRELDYDGADADARLDVFYPAALEHTGGLRLTIV